jgi:hypothetical protein
MCKQDHEIAEVNAAKCHGIAVLIFGIISCIGFLLSALTGPLISGIGGILLVVSSSIIICCGPEKAKPGGDGKLQAGMVCGFIGAGCEIGGAVVGIALFFGWKADIETACGLGMAGASYDSMYAQPCVDLAVGIVGALVWPSVAISIVAGILAIVFALKCKAGRTAMLSKGGSA